jgi:hypothetical protein
MALAGKNVQVLVAGYDLTGDSNKLSMNDSRNVHDVTAFGDGVHKFIVGPRVVSLVHAGYLNSAAASSHPVLKSAAVQGAVSVLLGQNANPAVGDPAFSLYAQQGQYTSADEYANYVLFSAAFANSGSLGGWGVALAVPVTFTNSTTGAGADNGAASTKGGTAFLHILQAAASDTYTIVVEGSDTSNFAVTTTLATFSLNASALGSEYKAIAGTINQYTRWKATRTGSAGNTVKIAVTLVRF